MGTTRHRKLMIGIGITFLVLTTVAVDRLIHLRRLMWASSSMKGIGAVYYRCEQPMDSVGPINGRSLIEKCDPNLHQEFKQAAQQITVFPGGCSNKSVIAWGPEVHYWGESWMPLAPLPKRAVLYEDRLARCVTLQEFDSFGCPR